jgi:FO synthase
MVGKIDHILDAVKSGARPTAEQALELAELADSGPILPIASALRDQGFGSLITYSRKVFIPLTQLCRDVCHYCTFAKTPKNLDTPFLSLDQALDIARKGAAAGCKEALFTLGERPELRYDAAARALNRMGYASTLHYLRDIAARVFEETGLLPHLNPGCMSPDELAMLRPVAPSMGMMLETSSARLSERGGPHFGSPDKVPHVRLEAIRRAGEARVPYTSGILIGIGETRRERVASLLALRGLNDQYGHIQEIIIQNFRAKPGTKMAGAPEPDLEELLWTIAIARILFGPNMSLQVPPNLNPGVFEQLIDAGINDWGGVSPVTADHVNPEAPWPHLDQLEDLSGNAGKILTERLTVYPAYIEAAEEWIEPKLARAVMAMSDADGYARTDDWASGSPLPPPDRDLTRLANPPAKDAPPDLEDCLTRAQAGEDLSQADIVRLFAARDHEFVEVCQRADALRQEVIGQTVTYAVNRNINYTNMCTYSCTFCAFAKGKTHENLRGAPYDLNLDEIARRAKEAWERGATEVCLQGGIHPHYTGQTYIDICRAIKSTVPDMHLHAFSPLEVWQGAATLGLDLPDYLQGLKEAGLGTLPGTAAEILDDEIRQILCPDKLTTDLWLEIVAEAHNQGFDTTATIMYGHVEHPKHWARHLLRLRELQKTSLKAGKGKLTEFVPLPFVHMEAPIFNKSGARMGPTFREAVLMHAVARLVLHPHVPNIQTSWTKMGKMGAAICLEAGANDLGGTLMNESISRAAGSDHGQELPPRQMNELIVSCGRMPSQRNTVYGRVSNERVKSGLDAHALTPVQNMITDRPKRTKPKSSTAPPSKETFAG